jgi:hypothetical protein
MQLAVPEFLSITWKVGFWPDAYAGGPLDEDLSSCISTDITQPDEPTGTPPTEPLPPPAPPPTPPLPPTPPFPPPAPAPAPADDVAVAEPVGPVTGYEFIGGSEPVGTVPGVIIAELPVGLAEAPDLAPLPVPLPEPEQAYAVNAIRMRGIPNTRMRRRQYTAGGSDPTGRRKDPTGRHLMASATPVYALAARACSTMRR